MMSGSLNRAGCSVRPGEEDRGLHGDQPYLEISFPCDDDSAAHAIPSVPGTARTDGDADRQEPRLDPSLSLASLSGPLAAVAPSLPAFGPAQGNGPYRRNRRRRTLTATWRALALNLNLSQQESSESLITAVALIAGLVAVAASAARGSCGTAFPLTDLQRRAWAAP